MSFKTLIRLSIILLISDVNLVRGSDIISKSNISHIRLTVHDLELVVSFERFQNSENFQYYIETSQSLTMPKFELSKPCTKCSTLLNEDNKYQRCCSSYPVNYCAYFRLKACWRDENDYRNRLSHECELYSPITPERCISILRHIFTGPVLNFTSINTNSLTLTAEMPTPRFFCRYEEDIKFTFNIAESNSESEKVAVQSIPDNPQQNPQTPIMKAKCSNTTEENKIEVTFEGLNSGTSYDIYANYVARFWQDESKTSIARQKTLDVPDYLYVYVVAGVFLSIVVVTFMVVYLQRIYIKTNKFFRSVKNCIPNVLLEESRRLEEKMKTDKLRKPNFEFNKEGKDVDDIHETYDAIVYHNVESESSCTNEAHDR